MTTEKRLADVNALLQEAHWVIRSDGTRAFVVHAEDIENAPTVDAVEVVRCKDCKHCRISHPTGKPTPFYFCKQLNGSVVKPDDFYSYGERRDNGKTD